MGKLYKMLWKTKSTIDRSGIGKPQNIVMITVIKIYNGNIWCIQVTVSSMPDYSHPVKPSSFFPPTHWHVQGSTNMPQVGDKPMKSLHTSLCGRVTQTSWSKLQTNIYNACLKRPCQPSGKPVYTQEDRVRK